MTSESRRGWADLVREIGEAFLALLRAEVEALVADFGRSGRTLARALVLAAAAGAVLFWALALVLYLAIELLAMVLPRWGAVAAVLGVFLAAAALLVVLARARFGALESPASTVSRRLDDSRRWWRTRVGAEESEPDPRAAERVDEELP